MQAPAEMLPPTAIIQVRRQWNDWRIGEVPLDRLRDFHWRRESGGVGTTSPYPMLYARMWCDSLVGGEIAHSCGHGAGPHEILVCMCKIDNKAIFKALGLMVRC